MDAMPDRSLPRTRLDVLFARSAQTAVLLRRNPRTHFHLITWDLATDTFVRGQWMVGHVGLWDLSPNGRKLLYWAHQYRPAAQARRRTEADGETGSPGFEPLQTAMRARSPKKREMRRRVPRYMEDHGVSKKRGRVRPNEGCWTAISSPPYFSALAIWPSRGHWTGGGRFESDHEILLNEFNDGIVGKENVRIPPRFKIRSLDDKPFAFRDPSALVAPRPSMLDPALRNDLHATLEQNGANWVEWAMPQDNGDLLFACDGCVYRLNSWQAVDPSAYLAQARKLADFNGLTFEPVRPPPEAMCW